MKSALGFRSISLLILPIISLFSQDIDIENLPSPYTSYSVTANDSTDDDAYGINIALSLLKPGETLIIPDGKFDIGHSLKISGYDKRIICKGSILAKANNITLFKVGYDSHDLNNKKLIDKKIKQNLVLEDLKLFAAGYSNIIGIKVSNITAAQILNPVIINAQVAIEILNNNVTNTLIKGGRIFIKDKENSVGIKNLADNTVVKEIAINGYDTSIYSSGKGFQLLGSSFYKHPSLSQQYGLKIDVLSNVKIIGNYFDKKDSFDKTSIYLNTQVNKSFDDIIIKDNYYKDGTALIIEAQFL